MADEVLNILVKLGGDYQKLDKIKASGINAKVNVTLGGDWTKLQKLMTSGLDLKVNLKLGGDFSKLQNLQTKGINISSRTSNSPKGGPGGLSQQQLNSNEVARYNQAFANAEKDRSATINKQLKDLFAQQQKAFKDKQQSIKDFASAFDKEFARVDTPDRPKTIRSFTAPVSEDFQREQQRVKAQVQEDRAREQNRREELAQQQKAFRSNYQLEKANKDFQLSPAFGNLDERKRNIAFGAGLLPHQITSAPKFFDPERLKDPSVIREIGFAGLFGQGLLGKATNVAGAVAGAGIGGPGGSLFGSTIASVGLESAKKVFEDLGDILSETAKKGLEFQKSVSSLSSIFQATSDVFSRDGQKLSTADSQRVLQSRSSDLLRNVQNRTSVIGVPGSAASLVTSALGERLTSSGVKFNDSQLSELAVRVLAGTHVENQSIEENPVRYRQDIIDSGLGGRSALKAAIGRLAPNLFQKNPGTIEDILGSSKGLAEFPALAENSPLAANQLQRISGFTNNIQSQAGSSFLDAASPGIKKLADAITNPELLTGTVKLAESLGNLASKMTEIVASVLPGFIEGLTKLVNFMTFAIKKLQGLDPGILKAGGTAVGGLSGATVGATGGAIVGGLAGLVIGQPLLGAGVGGALGGALGGFAGGAAGKLAGTALSQGITPQVSTASLEGATIAPNFESQLTAVFKQIGTSIEEVSKAADDFVQGLPEVREAILNEALQTIRQDAAQRKKLEGQLNRDLLEQLEKQEKANTGTFDTFKFSDAIAQAQYQKSAASQQLKVAKEGDDIASRNLTNLQLNHPEDVQGIREAQAASNAAGRTVARKLIQQNTAQRNEVDARVQQKTAQRQIRDATEQVTAAIKDEILQRNSLNRTLQETQQKLIEFGDNLKAAYASKEENILSQGKSLKDITGTSGNSTLDAIIDSPELTEAFKARGAASALSANLASVGLPGVGSNPLGAPDLISRQFGGSFQIEQGNQQGNLEDSVKKTAEELDVLPRKLRGLNEALNQILKTVAPKLAPSDKELQLYQPGHNESDDAAQVANASKGGSIGASGSSGGTGTSLDTSLDKLLNGGSTGNSIDPSDPFKGFKSKWGKQVQRPDGTLEFTDLGDLMDFNKYEADLKGPGGSSAGASGSGGGSGGPISGSKTAGQLAKGKAAFGDIVGGLLDSDISRFAKSPPGSVSNSNNIFNEDLTGGDEFKSQTAKENGSKKPAINEDSLASKIGLQMRQAFENSFSGS